MKVPIPPIPLPEELVTLARDYAEGRREPVAPRDAATVILLRDGAAGAEVAAEAGAEARAGAGGGGPEVYYLVRQTSMAFAGGMCVYPGGGVDPRDSDAEVAWAGPSPAEWARRLGCGDEDTARALVCAAVRETFEESGVLLAGPDDDPSGVVADTTDEAWEADRVALESREVSMVELLGRRGLVLRTDLLGVWDAWLTPVFEPRRYRTWFFVAEVPAGQRTRDVSSESSAVTWLRAGDAAARTRAGELALMPPTYLTTREVATYADAAGVMAQAHRRSVEMFTPTVEAAEGGHLLSVPERLRGLVAEDAAAGAP